MRPRPCPELAEAGVEVRVLQGWPDVTMTPHTNFKSITNHDCDASIRSGKGGAGLASDCGAAQGG